MDELSAQARAVIDAGLRHEGSPPGAKQRVRQAVAASIVGGVAASAAIAEAAPAAIAAWKAVGVAVVLTGGVAASVVGVKTVLLPAAPMQTESETPATVAPPAAAAPREEEVTPLVEPRRVDRPEPPPSSPREPTAPSAAPAATALAEELELIRAAHLALASGDAAHALELLAEHAEQFPDGELRKERLANRVFALCALGGAAAALEARTAFLEEFPEGALAQRVRAACANETR